jgi:hypothetical protein
MDAEMLGPLTRRTKDPNAERKQIRLQYAGIGARYRCVLGGLIDAQFMAPAGRALTQSINELGIHIPELAAKSVRRFSVPSMSTSRSR